ncbi:multiheme c-type cytochrome [Frigoriglobus tundricola]|uniref:multiheme c-type cytochrome n=1 Tax=Frigoriglobus tundricola TaxID=2774151 RepID=UPI00148EA4E5|nr:multiheme c-type cytochrome [Frigoriglobus tundricola]
MTIAAYVPPEPSHSGEGKGKAIGLSGCLAAACHGGPAEKALGGTLDSTTWQGAGSVWVAADPHSAAYSLLTDHPHRAVKVTAGHIMARYAGGRPATEDARCLACHTNPALAEPGPTTDPHVLNKRREGVSCEACHGNASGWVREHTNWRGNRAEAYAATGMVPLYDLGERAVNCLGCHVGAPAAGGLPVRDMNHDMIAAGHPRLNFDFAEYLRRLPPHWQEKDRTSSESVPPARSLNPAKAWLVGRTAHAEAACKLLASRAERSASDPRTPWPEFAEYNCASCHHNLRAASDEEPDAQWRKDAAHLHGRRLGAPQWQTVWPLTPAAALAAPTRAGSPLKDLLEKIEVPLPSRSVGSVAIESATRLAVERKRLVGFADADAVRASRKWLDTANLTVPEWDSGSQLLFGMAALERSRSAKPETLTAQFRTAFAAFVPPRVPLTDEAARRHDERDRWNTFHATVGTIRNVQNNRP